MVNPENLASFWQKFGQCPTLRGSEAKPPCWLIWQWASLRESLEASSIISMVRTTVAGDFACGICCFPQWEDYFWRNDEMMISQLFLFPISHILHHITKSKTTTMIVLSMVSDLSAQVAFEGEWMVQPSRILTSICNMYVCIVLYCTVILWYVMLRFVVLRYVIFCHTMSCVVVLSYLMQCYVMLCSVRFCSVLLCYVMLCYGMYIYMYTHAVCIPSIFYINTHAYDVWTSFCGEFSP